MLNNFKILLFPFSILYDLITRIRNFLYDIGLFKTFETPVFSIGVGNLAVGGTGKTPFTAYLIEHFSDHKIAVLSRGYGRKTKGYKEVLPSDTAETVGDEIQMLYKRYSSKAKFFVSENRKQGVINLLKAYPETELILFDDVYQHRGVKPSLNILLSTFSNPFFSDYLLPYGKLREARVGVKRADIILITKTDSEVINNRKCTIIKEIESITQGLIPVYFTLESLSNPTNPFGKKLENTGNVKVLSAIANGDLFEQAVAKGHNVIKSFNFRDHHSYSRKDLDRVLNTEKSVPIITTEKDIVKLDELLSDNEKGDIYIQKLSTVFADREDEFLRNLKEAFYSFNLNKN